MVETQERLAVVVTPGMDEYHIRLVTGVRSVLSSHGISVVVGVNAPFVPGLPGALVRLLRGPSVCGVIGLNAVGAEDEAALDELVSTLSIPAVRIGMSEAGATCIGGDNSAGMRSLMAHLLDDRGAGRPCLVRGIRHQPDAIVREAVFREELALRRIVFDEDLVVNGEFWYDSAYRETRHLLRRRRDMDSVVALNDLSALGAMNALLDEGINVPDQVIVTGFDNDHVASLNWPGLTTVDQNLEAQGEIAARRLLAEMAGATPGERIVVPARVVIRESTTPQRLRPSGETSTWHRARSPRPQSGGQDAVIGLNRALFHCRTIDQLVEALTSCLDGLGIERCFLALHEPPPDQEGAEVSEEWARLVLDYRDGHPHPIPPDVFRTSQLLPDRLRSQLDQGILAMQPVCGDTREIGYVVFERVRGLVTVSEILYLDLSRTLDAMFAAQKLEQHAALLEDMVAQRTRELEAEVITRRRAEKELQEEINTRRRTEEELQRANAQLQRLLMLDGLTRIANRVAFQRHLEQQWHDHALSSRQLALLMVDVDLFKLYNDHYGHLKGDETLRTVASCLVRAVREPHDLACRYGGEEFAIVLPGSDAQSAKAVATRFRSLLAEAAIPHATSTVAAVVTASIGFAVTVPRPGSSPGSIVEVADAALYRAKSLGRNRIIQGMFPKDAVTSGGVPFERQALAHVDVHPRGGPAGP
jgi:diguanylate cyclase (GGDEF)-like protein